MAQLVARLHGMEKVRGSNPLTSTFCNVSGHRSAFLVDVSGHRSVLCGEQRRLGKLPAVWRLPGVPGAILLPLRLLFTGLVAARGRWDS